MGKLNYQYALLPMIFLFASCNDFPRPKEDHVKKSPAPNSTSISKSTPMPLPKMEFLPAKCANYSKDESHCNTQFFGENTTINRHQKEHYTNIFQQLKEPSLYGLPPNSVRAYRILIHTWRGHLAIIRIEKKGETVRMINRFLHLKSNTFVFDETMFLKASQFQQLEHLLAKMSFWTSKTVIQEKDREIWDGTRVVIEGMKSDRYHLVDRQSLPLDNPIEDVRKFFLELSGNWKQKQHILRDYRM